MAYKSCFADVRKLVCFGEKENSHGNMIFPTDHSLNV